MPTEELEKASFQLNAKRKLHFAPSGGTLLSVREGEVQLRNSGVFALGHRRWCAFAARALSVPETESVEIDRRRGRAVVRYRSQAIGVADYMGHFSRALAADPPPVDDGITLLSEALADSRRIQLTRRNSRISSWQVLHSLPGRLRVRNLGLQDRPETVGRLELELRRCAGVLSVSSRSLTGTFILHFDGTMLSQADVLSLLDQAVRDLARHVPVVSMPGSAQWSTAQGSLGLAVVSQFLLPVLVPVTAAVMLVSNIPNFQQAWHQLRRRRAGLPVLYVAIVTGTLATGGYIAASTMTLCLLYWQQRRGRLTIAGRHALSSAVQHSPPAAWCASNGVEFEVPAADLHSGDVVLVKSGELVPADGRITKGTALLDEPVGIGADRLVSRRVGDEVLAGSFVVDGDLRVEVRRSGQQTLGHAVSNALTASLHTKMIGPGNATPRLADQTVAPVLLTAGLGLLVGDATAAVAIMRPDYKSGPQLGDDLTAICLIGECVDAGIVVRRPEVFEQFAGLDVLLFDYDPALAAKKLVLNDVSVVGSMSADEILAYARCAFRELNDPRAEALIAAAPAEVDGLAGLPLHYRAAGVELRDKGRAMRVEDLTPKRQTGRRGSAGHKGPAAVGVYCEGQLAGSVTFREEGYVHYEALLALRTRFGLDLFMFGRAGRTSREVADELGLELIGSAPRDEARADVIRTLRKQGRRVGYVGDPGSNPAAASAANVAISIAPRPTAADDVSDVWLLGTDCRKLVTMRRLSTLGRFRSQVLTRFAIVPNVACIAGAFLLGFTSLAVVLVTNLGTHAIASGTTVRLKRMERRLLQRRNRFAWRRPSKLSGQAGLPKLPGDVRS